MAMSRPVPDITMSSIICSDWVSASEAWTPTTNLHSPQDPSQTNAEAACLRYAACKLHPRLMMPHRCIPVDSAHATIYIVQASASPRSQTSAEAECLRYAVCKSHPRLMMPHWRVPVDHAHATFTSVSLRGVDSFKRPYQQRRLSDASRRSCSKP